MTKNRISILAAAVLGALGVAQPAAAALITSYTVSGNVNAEVAAYAATGATGASGTLTLSSIPVGATIQQAYLYGNNYFGSAPLSATFAGTALGSTGALATNGGFSSFRWDVTSLVTGNGSYTGAYTGATNSYGMALAVAFSDPSLPAGVICINDGAVDMGPTTPLSSTTCAGIAAGPGRLFVHTGADNALGESNDQVLYNGVVVAAPIDANIGNHASLFNLPVTNIDGTNTATLSSPSDQFGWDLAVFAGAPGDAAAPEPGSLALLGIALAGFGALRRRTRSS